MALGTQTGIAAGWHLGSYNYLNLVSVLQKTRTKLITGLFSATDSFIGFGERNPFLLKDVIGCQLGIEQELLHETLFLIAENITGKHNLGESSIGVAWYILPHWSISLAHQFSNPASGTLRATVLEITYVPSAHLHKRLFRKGHL